MGVWQTPVVTVWLCSFTWGRSVAVSPACVTAPFIWITWGNKKATVHWGGGVIFFEGWMAIQSTLTRVPTRYHPLSITVVARSMANVTRRWMIVGKTKDGSSIPFNLKTTSMWSSVFVFCDEARHTVCKQRTQGIIKSSIMHFCCQVETQNKTCFKMCFLFVVVAKCFVNIVAMQMQLFFYLWRVIKHK